MPSYRERLDALIAQQQGTPTGQPLTEQQPSASGLPTITVGGGQYIPLPSRSGVRLQQVPPTQQQKSAEMVEEQRIKNANPALTEMERERTPMAQGAVRFLDEFSKKLGVDEATGRVTNKKILSTDRDFLPLAVQEYLQTPETKNAYNDLESAFQLGSIVLTGRQGDIGKLKQLRDIYRFSPAADDSTIVTRLKNLKTLFTTFERGKTTPEELNKQMDSLIANETDRVEVEDKQGKRFTIPRTQMEQATKAGYRPR